MDRLVIERKAKKLIRENIAQLLGSSIKDLRNYYSNEMLALLERMNLSEPYVPDRVFSSDLFSEKDMNDFLDYLYIDLMIQYGDLYTLRDYLDRLRVLFSNTVVPQLIQAGEISEKVRNLKKLKDTKYAFTDIISEPFNKNVNMYQYSEKLSINPGAGIIRLPGIEKNYADPAYMNVRIDVISQGCNVVDSSDELNVYNNDPLSPFYSNIISTSSPVNTNKGVLEFENYQGVICDLVISFPDIVPVSRIGFIQFSDAPYRIIRMQTSTMSNQNIHYSGFTSIPLNDISYTNNEIEVNFEEVNAREIHVFILQEKYKSTKESIQLVKYKKIQDYIEYCSKAMDRINIDGYTENRDLDIQLSELFSTIKENTKFPTESVRENIRSYTVGLYNLKVSNVIYSATGYYTSENYDVNGNIISIAYSAEGKQVVNVNSIPAAAVLFNIETADNKLYMGELDDDSYVTDISTLELNTWYVSGELVVNDDRPLRLYTNFLPKQSKITGALSYFRMYFDEEAIPGAGSLILGTDYSIFEETNGARIELTSSLCTKYNLSDGVTVITKYLTADNDRYGNSYSPGEINLITRLGKPNLINHHIVPVENSYMYVTSTIGAETYSVGYSESEYGLASLSGELYYAIGTGKGEQPDFPDIVQTSGDNGISLYAHNKICTYPIDGMYASIAGEAMGPGKIVGSSVIGGSIYLKYKTDHPYIKGTMRVYDNTIPVLDILEYEDDEYQVILRSEESGNTTDKRTVYILSGDVTLSGENQSSINIYYLPISRGYTGYDITSNISSPNVTETFSIIPSSGIKLGRFPYLDMDIVNSDMFYPKYGIFTYLPLFSIVYEPVLVYVNGNKAKNITRYRLTDPEINKRLAEITRDDEYMYYITEDGTIVPNREMSGNITVQYYSMSDSIRAGIEMAKSNLYRDDITPELYSYTILANVKR